VWSLDQAERVAGRVSVDVFAVELGGAEGQHARSGGGDVFDHDVEMILLGHGRIGPGGWLVVRGQLEGQPRGGVVGRDHYPVVALIGDRLPEQLGVERRQRGWFAAVQNDVVQSSDHGPALQPA
jgi:hypothetical protein